MTELTRREKLDLLNKEVEAALKAIEKKNKTKKEQPESKMIIKRSQNDGW